MTTREKVTYCLANVAAALFALYVAFWLNLDRPYWAVFSVFIVSKPISGAVRAKGVYRFVGTLCGAAMAVFLVPPLVQAPMLLSLAVSLWVGFSLFFALQDRTPRSYAFLLAGYTVAIVGLSTVNAPTTVFDVAVSRLEEITIGITCASIAHSVFFPRNIADVIRQKAEEAIRLATQVAENAVDLKPRPPSIGEIATLATSIASLDTLYSQIGLETSNVPRLKRVMVALLDRLAAVSPRASIVSRSIEALRHDGQISRPLRSTLTRISSVLSSPSRGDSLGFFSFIGARPAVAEVSDSKDARGLTVREALPARHAIVLATTLMEARALAAALNEIKSPTSVARMLADEPRGLFYRDQGLAVLSAASAIAATMVTCVLWISTAWPEGFVAAQFAAICSSLFATVDAPWKPTFAAVFGIAVALPAAALYEFAILPGIDGFVLLALVLAPAFLLFSYLQTFEKLEGAAMVLAVAFSGALALQESFVFDFANFANANLAEMVGPLIAAAMLIIFRTIDPAWNARRILNSSWLVIRKIAHNHKADPINALLPMFDRAGQTTIRLATAPSSGSEKDVLLSLRVLLSIADLRHAGSVLGGNLSVRIDETLRQLGKFGSDQKKRSFLGRNLSTALERLSHAFSLLPSSVEKTEGMAAVASLQLDLDSLVQAAKVMP